MNKFDYPNNTDKIDKDIQHKFDEFLRVYIFGGVPASKSDPKSARSILAKNRTLKLKKKLHECEMKLLQKKQRISFSDWIQQGGNEIFKAKVYNLNDQRLR